LLLPELEPPPLLPSEPDAPDPLPDPEPPLPAPSEPASAVGADVESSVEAFAAASETSLALPPQPRKASAVNKSPRTSEVAVPMKKRLIR